MFQTLILGVHKILNVLDKQSDHASSLITPPKPHQKSRRITTIRDNTVLYRTVVKNYNRLFYLESIATSYLHVRKLKLASL
jgi:hypothetical protein